MLPVELTSKLETAVKAFAEQKELVGALQSKIATLEARVASIPTESRREMLRDLGEWDSEKTAKDFVDFLRAVRTGEAAVRALDTTTNSGADGGYTIPEGFRPTLLRLISTYGVYRQNATIIPFGAVDQIKIPNLQSGVTVYWPGENSAITESQPSFGEIALTVKKVAALVPSSSELLADSNIAIATLLATLVAEAMAQEEDRVGFVGDVSGLSDPYNGLFYDSNIPTLSMASGATSMLDITADDLLDLAHTVPSAAENGARFWMHRTVFDVVRKLKDNTGNYIVQTPTGTAPGSIWGYPYTLVDSLPSLSDDAAGLAFVLFGNLRYAYLNDRQSLEVAMSPHFKFNLDQIYFRWTQRIGFQRSLPTAFALLKTAAA